jgi:isopenicillin N synthase-like dioxygenase
MPALVKPPIVSWTPNPETKEQLEWAPLSIIDLSRFDEPGGKEALANELRDAVQRWGFWTVVNTSITQEQLDRQLDLANTFFKLPTEEKRKVPCDFSVGKYV